MQEFLYCAPTKVLFGKDTENQVAKLIKEDGGSKVLVHYGGESAVKSGLIKRVLASLKDGGLAFVQLCGVKPNPRLSLVKEGIELCKKEEVDYILAVGGGSVIDSAKAIAYGLKNSFDVWQLFCEEEKAQASLALGCILTIAAAGSEMSNSCVITNDDTNEKRGYAHDIYGRPRFAILNPALSLGLPAYQTAAGCTDILMHTLERYFTDVAPTMSLTDEIAEGLMRSVIENARTLMRQPDNLDARAQIMWASSLSHNGLTACGNGKGDWACHQLGHEISGKFDFAHGASLSIVFGSWARYVYKKNAARFAQFATNVMQIEPEDSDEETALAGIEELEGFFWAIEMPTSFAEADLSLSQEEIVKMAKGVSRGGKRTVGAVLALTEKDIVKIYSACQGT